MSDSDSGGSSSTRLSVFKGGEMIRILIIGLN
jgi:hypothetical protein